MTRIFVLFIVVFSLSVAVTKNLGASEGQSSEKHGIQIGGWLETGVFTNEYGSRGSNVSPFGNPDGHWGDNGNGAALGGLRNADFNVNQVGLYAHKERRLYCGWDWGFKVEGVFGTDAWIAQSWADGPNNHFDYAWGTGDYGFAIPQFYGEIGYHHWGLKIGRFDSPFAQDEYSATHRFFYSRSLAFNLDPVVGATGALLDYKFNNRLSVFGGWVAGFDTVANTYHDSVVLLGARTKVTKNVNLAYTAGIGTLGERAPAHFPKTDLFRQSLGTEWEINHCWQYNLNYNMVNYNSEHHRLAGYGLNNELIYKLSYRLAVGLRGEWYRDSGEITHESIDNYQISLGANWTPVSYMTIRPELRHDWAKDRFGAAADKDRQFSYGMAMVCRF